MKVILGAEKTTIEGWVSTNKEQLDILKENDWLKLFQYESIDVLLAEHVWEHMTFDEGIIAAKNCYNFLKNGGYIRCAVPDANFNDKWYQNTAKVGNFKSKDNRFYEHKIFYDYKMFKEVFQKVGFKVELLEFCDEDNNFHYRYWNECDGKIGRSYRFDTRNSKNKIKMVSIIIDAKKEIIL